MKSEMQVFEMVLPMIALIAPNIKGIEYERTLFELNTTVPLISNDRVLVDLMIVEKIPAFLRLYRYMKILMQNTVLLPKKLQTLLYGKLPSVNMNTVNTGYLIYVQ